MPNKLDNSSRFAADLKMAIAVSGKSLEDITRSLRSYKIRTTPEALRAWESGESLPRPHASDKAIAALEEILELAPDTLHASFLLDLEKTGKKKTRQHKGTGHYLKDSAFVPDFQEIDKKTDWTQEVYREELNENITVSADFRKIRQSVRVAVRVPYEQQGTLHVSSMWDKNSYIASDDIGVYEVEGARVGDTVAGVVEDGVVKTTTLILPEDCEPGDLHYISYEHRFVSKLPHTTTAERSFSWHLNLYSCSVTFLGRIPEQIEWVLTSLDENSFVTHKNIYTRPLTPTGNTVTISVRDIENAAGSITWN